MSEGGKPFGLLIQERSKNVERCAEQCNRVLQKYQMSSGRQSITLDEAAWFGAIVFLGMQEALKIQGIVPHKREAVNEDGARVVEVMMAEECATNDKIT